MNEASIFVAALEKANPAERAAFVNSSCGNDRRLRRRVEALLKANAAPDEVLEPLAQIIPTTEYEPITERAGSLIGPYKLLQQIGEGGMGTVFMAEQETPVRRKVAIKIIKPGMDSKQVVARFEAERQALAMMDHTNIARVFDAGTTESGRPYFVMELVHGVPFLEFCDANKLTPRERLELFIPVCQAIEHAHQKGIIHRDIKPSNILVTMYDDKPVPKVIDFGVAKAVEQRLTEKTLFTQYGAMVGTYEYMSPEQAEMNAFGVDTRSDVYSLGVLLYELLTGTTPLERHRLREAAFGEIIRLIKEEEPQRPSVRLESSGALAKVAESRKMEPAKLSSFVRGELDWIVMKCLEKDRTCRYDGASSLAKDVQRYLSGNAVEACPPTLSYRLKKAYRKNRIAVLVGSTIAAVLLLATAVSLAFGIQARSAELQAAQSAEDAKEKGQIALQQRDEADVARRALETEQNSRAWSDYVWSIQSAQMAWQQHQFEPTRRFLERTRPELRGWEWHYLNRLYKRDHLYALNPDGKGISSVKYSQDGRQIVTGGSSVQVWDTTKRTPVKLCDVADWADVDISPDSKQILVAERNKVTIWNLETRTAELPIVVDPDERNSFYARFSPDGTKIAIAKNKYRNDNTEDETVALWDTKTRKFLWSYKEQNMRSFGASFAAHGRWVYSMVWDPFAVERGHILKIWDVDTGKELLSVGQKFMWAYLSPDGSRLAAQDVQNNVTVWKIRLEGKRPVLEDNPIVLRGHAGTASPRTFSRDSKYLLTAGGDHTVRIWDAATGAQRRVLVGAGFAWADFSPDGKHVVTCNDGIARVWAVEAAAPQVLSPTEKKIASSLLSPDGRLLLSFDSAGAKILDAKTGALLHTLTVGRGGWSPDSKRIWISSYGSPAGGTKNKVRVYNAENGNLLHELEGVSTPQTDHCFNADGSQILTVKEDNSVHVWDINKNELFELVKPAKYSGREPGYSPDGTKIFVQRPGEPNSTMISILDARSRHPIAELEARNLYLSSNGTFSKDGRWFLAILANKDYTSRECRIWDATNGKLLRSFPINAWSTQTLEISPDGSRFLVTGFLESVHLLDATTGDELLTIPISGLRQAKFDRDGKKIIVNDGDKGRILDGTPELAK